MSDDTDGERRRALADREQERVRASASDDDVVVTYENRWAVPGMRAERRRVLVLVRSGGGARRRVRRGLPRLALAVRPVTGGPDHEWFTPLAGMNLGGALLCLSFAIISYVKAFLPREVAVRQRHDKPSPLAR